MVFMSVEDFSDDLDQGPLAEWLWGARVRGIPTGELRPRCSKLVAERLQSWAPHARGALLRASRGHPGASCVALCSQREHSGQRTGVI